jgi:hypothetical protein
MKMVQNEFLMLRRLDPDRNGPFHSAFKASTARKSAKFSKSTLLSPPFYFPMMKALKT